MEASAGAAAQPQGAQPAVSSGGSGSLPGQASKLPAGRCPLNVCTIRLQGGMVFPLTQSAPHLSCLWQYFG